MKIDAEKLKKWMLVVGKSQAKTQDGYLVSAVDIMCSTQCKRDRRDFNISLFIPSDKERWLPIPLFETRSEALRNRVLKLLLEQLTTNKQINSRRVQTALNKIMVIQGSNMVNAEKKKESERW